MFIKIEMFEFEKIIVEVQCCSTIGQKINLKKNTIFDQFCFLTRLNFSGFTHVTYPIVHLLSRGHGMDCCQQAIGNPKFLVYQVNKWCSAIGRTRRV